MSGTLAEKVWEAHVVRRAEEPDLLYIDLHLLHEVTSPQAFDGLRLAGAGSGVRTSPLATRTTTSRRRLARSPIRSRRCRWTRCAATVRSSGSGCTRWATSSIVHVVGPQLGLTQPGMTVVCGDSHTSTRRLRRARLRYRHVGGGARPGDPDAAAQALPHHGRQRPWPARRGRDRQGHRPGRHRQDRHRWGPGLRPRVPGRRSRPCPWRPG